MSAALLENFDLLADSLGGVAKLRELILSLAVRGRLVPQDPNDEPASELLKRIRAEKDRLIAEGKIKSDKPQEIVGEDDEPYELPVGWAWVRLGSALEMINGRAFKPSDWLAEGVPIVRIQNLNSADASFNYCAPSSHEERHRIDDNDFLISWSGTPGTSFGAYIWKRGPAALNQHIFKCIQKGSAFTNEYLRLAINGRLDELIAKAHGGVGLQHVTKGKLEALVLGLPPLAEQSRIVAKVEELMALCDRLEAEQGHAARVQGHWVEAALDQLAESADADEFRRHWQHLAAHFDTLFTTPESIDRLDATLLQLAVRGKLVPQDPTDEPASELLKQIRGERERLIKEGKIKRDKPLPPVSEDEQVYMLPMGWEWTRLQDLALAGPTNGFSPRPSPEETDFRCLTLSATTKGHLRPECFKFVEVDERTAQQFYLKQGDLLIQRGNSIDYVGISAIYDLPSDRFIYPDLMMRIQLTPSVDSRFVHRWLNCTFGRTYFMKNAKGTQGTMPKVNQTTVARTPVPLPPLAEQSRIVAQVEKLLSLTASLKARLTAAQTKQAHLAEALVAELTTATPTAPNAEERLAKRAQCGLGREAEGLALLEKAAGQ